MQGTAALLPYAPRPGQAQLVEAVRANQAAGGHLVAEAGTGTGKTVSALAATLASITTDGRRLVYATRTNSQQAQVVREWKAIRAAALPGTVGTLIPFMGRKQSCPLLRDDARFRDGTPEELGKLCRDAKERAARQKETGQPVPGACPYYLRLLQDGPGPVEALLEAGLEARELGRRIEAAGSCPYESLKILLPKAQAVTVPLVFVLDGRLRTTLLQWLGTGADEAHLVVDEAHHLPQAARDHHSARLGVTTLQRAMKEAEEYADPPLAKALVATTFLDAVLRSLHAIAEEHVRDEDGLVPPGALEEALLSALRVPSTVVERAARDLSQLGEAIRNDKRKEGRLPRSYLGAVADFVLAWMAGRDEPAVHLVTGGDHPALEVHLLDPAPVLSWLDDFHSTTHMSGTLEPLQEHARLCGIPGATLLKLESPFDPGHLQIWGLEGVHRSYEAIQRDPSIAQRQQEAARRILQRRRGKTGLFFPSHRMLEDYLEEGFLHGIGRGIHVERSGMSSAELEAVLHEFRLDRDPDALLLGVLGGRLSEGIDYPGKDMENLLVFGVPYPRPSARSQALIHYYDAKEGIGWQVAVHTPVARTLRQAIGRLIRSSEDRGFAVVLDERVVRFTSHLPQLAMAPTVDRILAGPAPRPGGFEPAGRRGPAQEPSRKAPPGRA